MALLSPGASPKFHLLHGVSTLQEDTKLLDIVQKRTNGKKRVIVMVLVGLLNVDAL